MLSLLYVSRSRLADFATDELADILAVAVPRNLNASITGALAYTGTHFAQALEGPEPAVSEVMSVIHRDPRHQDIRVLRAAYQSERRFPNWGMALIDGGPAVQRLVDQALASDCAFDWLAEELITALERSATPAFG